MHEKKVFFSSLVFGPLLALCSGGLLVGVEGTVCICGTGEQTPVSGLPRKMLSLVSVSLAMEGMEVRDNCDALNKHL